MELPKSKRAIKDLIILGEAKLPKKSKSLKII